MVGMSVSLSGKIRFWKIGIISVKKNKAKKNVKNASS